MKKMLTGLSLVAVVCAAWLYAGTGGGGQDGPASTDDLGHLKEIMDRLQMTEAQRNAALEIIKNRRGAVAEKAAGLAAAFEELFERIHAEVLDEDAVRSACRKKAAVEEELHVLLAGIAADVQALLTPEQRVLARGLKKVALAHVRKFMENIHEGLHGKGDRGGSLMEMLKRHLHGHGRGHGGGHGGR